MLSTTGSESTRNLRADQPSPRPNRLPRIVMETIAVSMACSFSQFCEPGETHESQRHQSGSNQADWRSLEVNRYVRVGDALPHG